MSSRKWFWVVPVVLAALAVGACSKKDMSKCDCKGLPAGSMIDAKCGVTNKPCKLQVITADQAKAAGSSRTAGTCEVLTQAQDETKYIQPVSCADY